ncbi:nucleotidyltransferase domain-containing protein [Streptomyces sp. MNP-20]|uniref:nucleotidyltransferase domain-containing protein n=1 Tax=Streptomyces sp. MNP-20 TaxID=2721165 RepID=UPI001557F821|nr:nucleotidyltransferase domain-containing protein [Streptomyces sp. MNP-20]
MGPFAAARAVVGEKFPAARAAFLGGSAATERRTPTSDLDVVVLLPGPPAPYRESLLHGRWPVELFVHTEESWQTFVEREIGKRRSPLLWMCAEGVLLLDRDGVGEKIATEAQRLVTAGVPEVTMEELEDRRYAITDLLDDLAACDNAGERLFIVTELARRTAELVLAVNGAWLGGGKWLARHADATEPGFSAKLSEAVRDALAGREKGLVGVVDAVLDRCGGRLWAGYRRGGVA